MKKLNSKSICVRVISAALVLLFALLANNALATFKYWDNTGNASNPTSGVWDTTTASWSTTSALTATPTTFNAGDLPIFCAGTATAGSITVSVNTPNLSVNGVYNNGIGGYSCLLTLGGTGSLSLPAGFNSFYVTAAKTTTVNIPINGPGGLQTGATGNLYLHGANTFSGGVNVGTATLIFFNNGSAFGTGPINLNSGGSGGAFVCEAAGAITVPNNFVLNAAYSYNFTCNPAGVTYSGNWNLNGNTIAIGCGNNSTANLNIISGIISGTGGIGRQVSTVHGTLQLTGANNYTGKTSLQSSVTSVSSINSVSSPAQQTSSSLGVPSSAANGTLSFGSTTYTGTLLYTGLGETSDRVIDLAGTTGGATIQNDGSGALVLTALNTASVAGAKTLTLQGSSIAVSSIGKIVDSIGGATAVIKAGTGTWKLTGANTYTGGTTVNAGTLEISGSVAGSVTNTAGVMTLDNPSTMASGATLAAFSGSTVNLSFTGTNAINALIIDGTPVASGVWGSTSSTAPNTSAIFAGTTGFINVLGKPVVVQQPVPGSVFPDQSFTFNVGVVGDLATLTYQWKLNGNNIANATDSSYVIATAEAANNGIYSCWVTNLYGWTNSANAMLMVMGTNAYTQTIRGDSPISYWRLDETNGTIAYDAVGGNNGGYNNVTLNQPGFAPTDPDPGISLPTSSAARGYVQVNNYAPFNFNASSTFTLEGWVNSTNFTTKQRLFSTLYLSSPGGYAFGILPGGTQLEFTAGAVRDTDTTTLPSALVTGTWYHLVLTCDGNTYIFYVNGNPVYSTTVSGGASAGVAVPLVLGCNPPAYTIGTGDGGAEQVKGSLDEMAIYNTALSQTAVTNHYLARYGTLTLPIASAPSAIPPTNYVSLSSTLQANAAGQLLTYQWYKGVAPGGTLLSGQTGQTLTLSPLQLTDAGSYWVQVTNPKGTVNSPSTYLAVLPIPTNASQLNLTNGLVLHLPFDSVSGGVYNDISGRSNNGTNVGATTLVSPGAVGANALHYSSTVAGPYNYVTLGVRPDLQFSTNDFTVSYWVRQPALSTFTNLPFFTDAIGSTFGISSFNGGFVFAPFAPQTLGGNIYQGGGWSLAMGTTANSMSSPSTYTSFPDSNLINDGNWHHLVHVASRVASVATYLDGVQVDSEAISFIGNINTANAATIGQDPTGTYPVTAAADIDDLAVWTNALTPLQISGIYLAGVSNSVSFAPPVVVAPPPTSTTISNIIGTTLSYGGGSGSQFVLLGTNNVTAPLANWTRIHTNPASPGTFTLPAPGYYRIKSE